MLGYLDLIFSGVKTEPHGKGVIDKEAAVTVLDKGRGRGLVVCDLVSTR